MFCCLCGVQKNCRLRGIWSILILQAKRAILVVLKTKSKAAPFEKRQSKGCATQVKRLAHPSGELGHVGSADAFEGEVGLDEVEIESDR